MEICNMILKMVLQSPNIYLQIYFNLKVNGMFTLLNSKKNTKNCWKIIKILFL